MPTESSVADQMVRLTPSQVGSRVFWRTRSSTVLKMEQMVALGGVSWVGEEREGARREKGVDTYMRPRQKTRRRPHWVREESWTVER